MFLKFIITTSIILPTLAMASIAPIKSKQEGSFKHISYQSSDIVVAKYFQDLISDLKNRRLHAGTLNMTNKLVTDKSDFAFLNKPLSLLVEIADNENYFPGLRKTCQAFHRLNLEKHPTYSFLKKSGMETCIGKYISFVSKKRDLSSKDLQFFDQWMSIILTTDLEKEFISLFKRFRKNRNALESLSGLATDFLIRNNMQISQGLLNNLLITERLTSYIQNQSLYDGNASKYFLNEFKILHDGVIEQVQKSNFDNAMKINQQLLAFADQNREFIPNFKSWRSFLDLGIQLDRLNQPGIAFINFDYALRISTPSRLGESYFRLLWHHLSNKNFSEASAFVNKNNLIKNFSEQNVKLKFWIAHTTEKVGDTYLAKYLFKNIVENTKLTYYSILALKRLNKYTQQTTQNVIASLKDTSSSLDFKISDYSQGLKSSVARLKIWAEIGNENELLNEIKYLIGMSPEYVFSNSDLSVELSSSSVSKHIIHQVTGLLNRNQFYLQTFKVIYESLGLNLFSVNNLTLKRLFPTDYISTIKTIDPTIDPFIVLSLIRQESAFNPDATSRVGARGLMQLMPETAKSIRKNINAADLKDPKINLKLGITYLKNLLNKYDGNLIYALISYNAGESRLRRWQNSVFTHEDPLMIIEEIPFRETRNYVKYILRNLFFYQLLADKVNIDTPLKEEILVGQNSTR